MRIGIVGATGAVGQETIQVLKDRRFPVTELHLFASERSAGKTTETAFGPVTIEAFSVEATRAMDIVFLAVSGDFAKEFAPAISSAGGAIVIDNSSAFRYDDAVPLVVPEINGRRALGQTLIANPNCTTAILLMALAPLHAEFGVKRAIVSTYQAASGAGAEGMTELAEGAREFLADQPVTASKFAHPLAFNLIPHIDSFQDNGYTREEMKVLWETRKIMEAPEVLLSCTAVRVPTMRAHAEAVTIETLRPITPAAARAVLAKAPGVQVTDDPAAKLYPMPLTASTKYDVEVGRIRESLVFGDTGLDFFVCGDQLLKGAALNTVQIAEILI